MRDLSIGLCGIEISVQEQLFDLLLAFQSDCVELKCVELVVGQPKAGLSIGLCGIEIGARGHGYAAGAGFQSDCVELKLEDGRNQEDVTNAFNRTVWN